MHVVVPKRKNGRDHDLSEDSSFGDLREKFRSFPLKSSRIRDLSMGMLFGK
jgi:hypothetical protein